MRKHFKITPFKIGLLFSFAVVFLAAWNPRFLEITELQLLDQRFLVRGPLPVGPEVVIAVVDEKSQAILGRWPWPRSTLAALVDKLNSAGAATVGLDMVFSESGNAVQTGAVELIEKSLPAGEKMRLLREIAAVKTPDAEFADAIGNAKNVILGYFFHDTTAEVQHLDREQIRRGLAEISGSQYASVKFDKEADWVELPGFPAAEANLPLFSKPAAGQGFFNLFPDADGVVRRYPLIIKADNGFYPPLFLRVVAHYLGKNDLSFTAEENGENYAHIGKLARVPADRKGKFLINYYGGEKRFPHISVVDIVQGKIDPDRLEGRIVLVGTTGKGIADFRATPFAQVFPGVEINATIIDNIIHNRYLRQPSGYLTYSYLLILLLGLASSYILSRLKAAMGLSFSMALLIFHYYINQQLFNRGIWINLVYPSIQILAIYASITAYNYFFESKQKQFIRGAFNQYLSPTVIQRLIDNPALLTLGGEQKRLTAFFSDVAGFSTISEKLTPHQLVALLNEYLTAMTDIAHKYEGTIDKYEGDAIIAFFGAPMPQEDHAARACLASLEMQKTLAAMREGWKKEGRAELTVRIGLNTGMMVVGNMGSRTRMDYTIMGDSVNLASRLEGVNKEYGTDILISQFTYEDVKDIVETRELDKIRVVGKLEPISIYEVLALKGELDAVMIEVLDKFAAGLSFYRQKRWREALEAFNKVLAIKPDDEPTQTMIARCWDFRGEEFINRGLPENWDGVYEMKSK